MTPPSKYRVGLVGAGQISEFHVRALQRLPQAALVGVTDLDSDRARAVAKRFGLPEPFPSLDAMAEAGLDVVHVLTPPSSHAAITLRALELGCHVLVEKPLATSAEDCDRIAEAARRAGKAVCVDHAMLCDPFVERALNLVKEGAIGEVVSADYFRSQSYPPYAGGPLPPQYREGGYPFRDMGVHALYLLQAFLGSIEEVRGQFATRGGDPNLLYDEWRALVRCARGTGHAHLSWNVKPFQNLLLVQGTRGVLRADLFGMSVTTRLAGRLPEFVQRAVNAWGEGWKSSFQVVGNVARVARKKILRYHGLQMLVARFYDSLAKGEPVPVTPEQARPVVEWTERVAREADLAKEKYLRRFPDRLTAPILVTGSSGFIGRHLLERLLADNQRVRILVRREPPASLVADSRVEVVLGDLGDPAAVERAVAGVEQVYHLGAGVRGTAADIERGTVAGTRNLIDSVLRHRVPRLVYVSSLSVLHAAAGGDVSTVTETWPLEPHAGSRGAYTKTKYDAEQLIADAVRSRQLPAVLLRPGQVFGPGGPVLTPAVCQRLAKRLLILGNGEGVLPLVYVTDVVDALILAAEKGPFDGSVFHLVDSASVTQNQLVQQYLEATGTSQKVTRLPRWLVYGLALGVQAAAGLLRRTAPLSVYRVRSALAFSRFDCTAARTKLGWQPRVGVEEGLKRTLAPLAGQQ